MRCRVAFAVAAFIVLCAVSAGAQVIMKPVGGVSMPLRLKSVTADVDVDGQFASTKMQLVFYNETDYDREAEFICSLPDMSTATYFAYWAGEEKVVARVVEKEKAALIYGTITSWGRDPALVEMTGKNTFRARVFPVFPGSDLKIEIRFVQVLPTDGSDIVYTLPFLTSTGVRDGWKLESANIKLDIKRSSDILQVINNYGLDIERKNGGYHLALNGTNYRPPKDLKVRIKRSPKPLMASMCSARSGGKDGFFALALTPDRSLTNAKVTVKGVPTYEVVCPETAKAGQVMLVVGRYKGSGSADVILTGRSSAGRLKYTVCVGCEDRVEKDNAAAKLWASKRIEQLSYRSANKSAVMKMSTQFCLPSKYTSWLAVPKAEMEIYKQEKARIEAQLVLTSLARMIADGKGNTSQARQLRSRVERMKSDELGGYTPKEAIKGRLRNVGRESAESLVRLVSEGSSDYKARRILKGRVERAARILGEKSDEWFSESVYAVAYDIGYKLMESKFADHPDMREINALNGKLSRLRSFYGNRVDEEVKSAKESFAWSSINDLAEEVAYKKMSENPDMDEIARLEKKMARINLLAPSMSWKNHLIQEMRYLAWREYPWLIREIDRLRNLLITQLKQPEPDDIQIWQTGKRFIELNTRYRGKEYAEDRFERIKAQVKLDRIVAEMNNAITEGDKAALNKLKPVKQELETQVKKLAARMGDPLISVDAPADAKRVVALLPDGEQKLLEYNPVSRRWEARFDIPMHVAEGDYVIRIVVILKDGTRRMLSMDYKVDTTPPSGKGYVSVEGSKLRLSLKADADTARAAAVLPWGEKVELIRSAASDDTFFATIDAPTQLGGSIKVEFVLTDKAHNRASVYEECRAE